MAMTLTSDAGRGGEVVACVAYADGRKVRDCAVEEASGYLGQDGHFVWIGLNEPSEALLKDLQREFGLHELAIEDAHAAHQRPKLEEYGQSLFVVLRTAQLDEQAECRVAFGETHVFVGPNYVVTVRHGASLPYSAVRARCEASPQLLQKGSGFVLYALMDFVVDNYFPIIDSLEDELEKLEDAIFGGGYTRDTTERIYDLKRELVTLKRAVAPLVEVCNRLVRFDIKIVPDDIRLYFRDVYDHVIRINETIDNLRELLTAALESNLSLISIRQNEVMKRLGAWAAIAAVPTLIAGIYGMNFEYIPELHYHSAYFVALGAMLAICAALWVGFKRADWL
jgi:magnesium transporter